MQRKTALLALSAMACAHGIPAHAQEQTVENAQKFLHITLPGNGYMSGGNFTTLEGAARESGTNLVFENLGIIRRYEPIARCRQATTFDYSGVMVSGPGARMHPDGMGVVTGEAVFANLAGARVDGDRVLLSWKGSSRESVIDLNSPDLAARVAYAFEFLRLQCDPAADTGF